MTKASLEFHPICLKQPEMSDDDFALLCARIKKFGLRQKIKLLDGKIFDGRYRYLACLETGVEPRFETIADNIEPDDANELSYDLNVPRRHFTASQRAMMIVEDHAEQVAQSDEGGKIATAPDSGKTREKLAKAAHSSPRTIQDAVKVRDKAATEIKAAVKAGTVKVSDAAAIADKSVAVQKKALERVAKGDAKTLREATKGKQGKPKGTAHAALEELFKYIGRAAPKVDAIKNNHGGDKFAREITAHLDGILGDIKDWKRALR